MSELESAIRFSAVNIARKLAGGENGYSCNYGEAAGQGYDPDGNFAAVTENRQATWKDAEGKKRAYSACEDLHGATYFRVLGMPPINVPAKALDWCNRVEAGRKWIAGKNLDTTRTARKSCWKLYGAGTEWDIKPGDAVQILGRCAHTIVILDVRMDGENPIEVDTAEYGQFHQPKGAKAAGHSCRCYTGKKITKIGGVWAIGGAKIYGRVSLWALIQAIMPDLGRELAVSKTIDNAAEKNVKL